MKVLAQQWSSVEPPDSVFEEIIRPKHVLEEYVSRPNRGLHLRKHMRFCDIIFDARLTLVDRYQVTITLTESEVFQLAKLCRRGRTDEALLKAIGVAGQTKRKRRRTPAKS